MISNRCSVAEEISQSEIRNSSGFSLWTQSYGSLEQLNETLANTPLFLFSEFEVRPLTDYSKYMDNIAAAFEKQGR